jgi:hypothetical protein
MKDFPWGYIVGAAVTVIGLLVNQWRADRREIDRWNKETERDRAKWQREQTERLEQWQREDAARTEQWKREDHARWIEERRSLYAASLNRAWAYFDQLQTLADRRSFGPLDVNDVEEMVNQAEDAVNEAEEAFGVAAADTLVIASDPVMRALDKLRSALQDANWAVMFPAFTEVKDMKPKVSIAGRLTTPTLPLCARISVSQTRARTIPRPR